MVEQTAYPLRSYRISFSAFPRGARLNRKNCRILHFFKELLLVWIITPDGPSWPSFLLRVNLFSSWAGIYNSSIVGPAYNGSKHAVVSITETLNMEECSNGIRGCVICPAEVNTPILDKRPAPPSAEQRARMLQPEDLGRTICWVAEQPLHVCINEIIISPTWNRVYTE